MSWNSALVTARRAPTIVRTSLAHLWPLLRSGSREFAWVCAGQLGAALGCIAGVRLLTEVLQPADYGAFMLAMTFVGLAQQVLASPLTVAAQRYYAVAAERQQLDHYRTAVWQLIRILTGLTLGAGAIASIVCYFLVPWAILIAISATAFAVLLSLAAVFDGMLNAARLRVTVAIHQAVTQWSRWLLAAGAVVVFGSTANIALLGGCVALALLCCTRWMSLSGLLHRRGLPQNFSHSAPALDWRKALSTFGRPFALWGFFTWALAASDRWMLAIFAGRESVGSYAVLYQLGFFPCVMLADALQQLVAPILFQRAGVGAEAARWQDALRVNRQLLNCFAIIAALMVVAAWLLHQPILGCFAASQYRSHSALLPWIVAAGGLFALGQIAALSIVSGQSARTLLPVKVGSAFIGIVANGLGARWYGVAGVVAAMVVSSALYLIWTLWIVSLEEQRMATPPG